MVINRNAAEKITGQVGASDVYLQPFGERLATRTNKQGLMHGNSR